MPMKPGESALSASNAALLQGGVTANVETDITVQAFAQWLTEMKARNGRTLQEMLAEMSIIRDGITSNNVELTDFKRHSSGITGQMQSQLTDLREKLTNAFGEITTLVKQKTTADQEMMQDINSLQGNLSCKTAEIENLKRSYSQAHQQLQSSLIQITNHMSVTKSEVTTANTTCERVQYDTSQRLGEIETNLRGLEETLSVGNAENRNQMLQLQEEIARIHESLASVSAEFIDHKRSTNSVHNKLQSQVWSLEEGRKRGVPLIQEARSEETTVAGTVPVLAAATAPALASTAPAAEVGGYQMMSQVLQPAGSPQAQPEFITVRGVTLPCYMDSHLSAMHPIKLREHALLLYRTFGHEAIGSAVPSQDGELLEWVSRIHKFHLEPLRATSAVMRSTAVAPTEALLSSSMIPTQQYVVASGSVMPTMQQTTAPALITPGLPTRPGTSSMIMARPPVSMSPQALR